MAVFKAYKTFSTNAYFLISQTFPMFPLPNSVTLIYLLRQGGDTPMTGNPSTAFILSLIHLLAQQTLIQLLPGATVVNQVDPAHTSHCTQSRGEDRPVGMCVLWRQKADVVYPRTPRRAVGRTKTEEVQFGSLWWVVWEEDMMVWVVKRSWRRNQGQSTYEYIMYLGLYTPGKRQLKVFEMMKSLDWICLLETLFQPRWEKWFGWEPAWREWLKDFV